MRSQDGYAVPVVLGVLAIVLGFGAVTVAIATHNVDRSEHDRAATRALQAADAGLDAAAYRMDKMLLASKVDNVLSTSTLSALLAEVGCLRLGVGTTLTATFQTAATCTPSDKEELDADVSDDGVGPPANFKYFIKLRANVLSGGHSVIERQIISIGEVDGVIQRVTGLYRFDLQAPVTSTSTMTRYAVCTARDPASGTDPAAGCPTL
jgi:hypothetical protein